MPQTTIRTGVELDPTTDAILDQWAEGEGRSKRKHAAHLIAHLAALLKTHRDDLERLGLAHKRPPADATN